MKYKYIFFDWGYTLINKFKNVDSEINSILRRPRPMSYHIRDRRN